MIEFKVPIIINIIKFLVILSNLNKMIFYNSLNAKTQKQTSAPNAE